MHMHAHTYREAQSNAEHMHNAVLLIYFIKRIVTNTTLNREPAQEEKGAETKY